VASAFSQAKHLFVIAPLALKLYLLDTHRWRGGLTSSRAYGAEKS
jgi:hypothetical protein